MSQKAAFFRAVSELARQPGGGDVLARIVTEFRPVVRALEAGDGDVLARELMGDVEARFLLSQALPDWDWRE